MQDRFGPPPPATEILLTVARVRCLARAAGVTGIRVRDRRAYLKTDHGLLKGQGKSLPLLRSTNGEAQLAELDEFLRGRAR